MRKPIPDKAKVAVQFPNKLYIDAFEQRAVRSEANFDQNGISLSLHRLDSQDTRKSIRMRFHCGMFAEILRGLAKTANALPKDHIVHREELRAAAKSFYDALKPDPRDTDVANLSAEEAVRLLHIME